MIGLEGDFPTVNRDSEGAITVSRGGERMNYRVVSDRTIPPPEKLRADKDAYPTEMGNYLALPSEIDPRIAKLAAEITQNAPDRYSKARAMESYLQNNFGYTLEMKAGGQQPLADFLFNVKEGHCEYFATAMAVMLRTQGIATRIVNGFQLGEYNDAADIWIVRQRDAHSWVEVYFPKEKTWVSFDPTPFAGQNSATATTGLFGNINKYLEALETYWIQYFVSFDDQEQQSLVKSAQKTFSDYQTKTAILVNALQEVLAAWWSDIRGDGGLQTRIAAIAFGAGCLAAVAITLLAFVWAYRKAVKSKIWIWAMNRFRGRSSTPIVEFYERMLKILSKRGLTRKTSQTPLEFAVASGITEAIDLTETYNRVRFGERKLSAEDKNQIERLLRSLHDDKD